MIDLALCIGRNARRNCVQTAMVFCCLLPLLATCSTQVDSCGEAFCMRPEPTSFRKSRSVDSNSYEVFYGGIHYFIYEGNAPDVTRARLLSSLDPADVPDGFVEGKFFHVNGQYRVLFRTIRKEWPMYVSISSANLPDVITAIRRLRGRA
jgi:hypothetical protein